MLEKPDIPDETIAACLRNEFGLSVTQVDFLPLGADQNTAVYRAREADTTYFVKLRSGNFNQTAVVLPVFIHDQGVRQIILPLETRNGKLWANLDTYKLILYPFIDGWSGYEISLSDRQWRDFGAAIRRLHMTKLPQPLADRIPRETFSPQYRQRASVYLEQIQTVKYEDPTSIKLAEFLIGKRDTVIDLINRTELLVTVLQLLPLEYVLCHSDLHAGNILVDAAGGFYIIDWDDPIFAPKERDLMFIGGGQGFSGYSATEEEALFYQGYGSVQVDKSALAYYRCERIVVDIALFCEQILSPDEGEKNRMQALRYLMSNFEPGGTIETVSRRD